MKKKNKPAAKPKELPPLPRKRRRRSPGELHRIMELAEALQPKRRRIKMETVPFGMDD